MDRHLIAMLHNEVKIMRADLAGIDPANANKPGRMGSGISMFIAPFNDLLARVQAAVSGDDGAHQALKGLSPAETLSESFIHGHVEAKFKLTASLGRMMAVLDSLLTENPGTVPMRATREGVFFAGEYFEPLRLLADLIKQAHKSINVIDGYIGDGESVLGLLAGKAKGVGVRILTYDTQDALLTLARAFNKQHSGLQIRASRSFHDRFLILDEGDYYHFGASLKDMGVRGFMFSRIEEVEVIERIHAKFAHEWENATTKI
jgi:hypothetical protein